MAARELNRQNQIAQNLLSHKVPYQQASLTGRHRRGALLAAYDAHSSSWRTGRRRPRALIART